MWRDLERICFDLDLPFRRPQPFPKNGLLAARVALIGLSASWGEEFCRGVFRAEFGECRQIDNPTVIADILSQLHIESAPALEAARTETSKAALRTQTGEAEQLGIFGAPSFTTADVLKARSLGQRRGVDPIASCHRQFVLPRWRGEGVISFHSVPILLSHSLNDGRSISSNSGQPEIDCGDSHGCFMVSGVISRILALLNAHRWIENFGFGQAPFFRRRHLLWQWGRNNVGGLRLSFLVRAAGALYVIPTMPFGMPIQPFIWPQLLGFLFGPPPNGIRSLRHDLP